MDDVGASLWVSGAIAETAQQGSAWNLFEEELLERLANTLREQHPKLCKNMAEEQSSDEIFEPIQAAAADKLSRVSAAAPSRHRSSLADIVRLAQHAAAELALALTYDDESGDDSEAMAGESVGARLSVNSIAECEYKPKHGAAP